MRKRVFLEMAFWDKFLECYPVSMPLPDEKGMRRLKAWIELFSFLSRSSITADCSAKEFSDKAETDQWLRYLWKKSTENDTLLSFGSRFNDLDSLFSTNPFCVLFSGTGKGPCAERYGVINLNGGNCLTMGSLFIDNGMAIRQGDVWSWSDFEQLFPSRCSNSMIIVDNYILKNGLKNLPNLLERLLPDSCEIDYHLSIFYLYNQTNVSREDILDIIRMKKPGLVKNLILELFPTVGSTEFHDRAIITNNVWIAVGGGFDLTCNGRDPDIAKRSTTIEILYPYFATDNNQLVDVAYDNLLQDAKEALRHSKLTSVNRLLNK